MKKVFLIFVLCLMLVLPFRTFAETTYETMNLDEALTQEKIEHDFSNYKETDDQITIYLFRGYGCGFCRNFLTFLNSIIDEYGKYFKVVSYETWYDEKNYNLMMDVSTFLGQPAQGVPYVIIGDKVFPGYASDYDDSIKKAIKDLYNTKKEDRYDVMEKYDAYVIEQAKNVKSDNNSGVNPWIIVAINFAITAVGVASIIYITYKQNKILFNKLNTVEQKLTNIEKKNEKVIPLKEEKVIKEAKIKKTTKK